MTQARISNEIPPRPFLSKLKGFVSNTNEWEGFLEALEYEIELQRKQLEQAKDPIEIYQAQGAIFALRRLKFLRNQCHVE